MYVEAREFKQPSEVPLKFLRPRYVYKQNYGRPGLFISKTIGRPQYVWPVICCVRPCLMDANKQAWPPCSKTLYLVSVYSNRDTKIVFFVQFFSGTVYIYTVAEKN